MKNIWLKLFGLQGTCEEANWEVLWLLLFCVACYRTVGHLNVGLRLLDLI